ncbi:Putative actin interacting protein [Heterostelium album PN500]|uniref:D-2-hydroxyglutarate dehydrogenase, mitochondrial n=1 Tax=Heterostelium pallidum (strain ATCC 26659 / Pp 5 / PN500) TaxID=670386 RepID=D3AZP8_HETP5|nr:Putative actin interacting protein [Heterostelium album PN500]EFA85427.1 Putative actin interacting protein [Heterostelium album PN500]|eukprot:XP_020437536.1 Putative actin interacting protein [Heterostelium album PN500]
MLLNRITKSNFININKSCLKNYFCSVSSGSSTTTSTTTTTTTANLLKVKRDDRFSYLNKDDISVFKKIMNDESGVITDADDLVGYNHDWMNKYHGNSQLVLRPKSTEQVSQILKYCNERRLAVVPQGGNTGLVGGSVPVHDEIVLSLQSMNKIHEFDSVTGVLTCDAGCILESLEQYLEPRGFTVPLDLGAKGSCQIGGNAATNAGGIRLLRYGSMHANVMGVEAVLADGTIVDCLSTLRKDNTGYDLKQLFIGSEGTLGVITKLAILTPAKPTSVHVALLSCDSFDEVKKLLIEAKKQLGDILSAFEFMDRSCIDVVLEHQPQAREPFDSKFKFYVLLEVSGFNEQHDNEKLNSYLEDVISRKMVADGTFASDSKSIAEFWKLRETITESLGKAGAVYKYDLSLPMDQFYNIVEVMKERLAGKNNSMVCGFGHVGDGNLHLNISTPKQKYNKEFLGLIEPFVYEFTSKHNGSISAEHGIGAMKTEQLHHSKTNSAIQLMRSIKQTMDPNGILNPYKVLPN